MRRAIFFDRDGVINPLVPRPDGRNTSPWCVEEFVLLPRVREAFELVGSTFTCFVVTNQPHVGHEMTEADAHRIHDYLRAQVPQIVDVRYCSAQGSSHYKPHHGMLLDLTAHYPISPLMRHHFMVGDRWKDIVCGHNAGTRTVFVGDKYTCGEYPYNTIFPDYHTRDIYDACQLIMEIACETSTSLE